MGAPLRRVARFVRLALVCLALVWSCAPAAVTPITDAVALIVVNHEVAAEHSRPAESSDCAAPAPDLVAPVPLAQRFAGRIGASRVLGSPRRLYLEQRALLC